MLTPIAAHSRNPALTCTKVFKEMIKGAEAGNVSNQLFLGMQCREDMFLDYDAAIKWLTIAAKNNSIEAHRQLAKIYHYGRDGRYDDKPFKKNEAMNDKHKDEWSALEKTEKERSRK
jgi:TPR repeat protein